MRGDLVWIVLTVGSIVAIPLIWLLSEEADAVLRRDDCPDRDDDLPPYNL